MSIRIKSTLPFSTLFFPHWDLRAREMGVLIVKGRFPIKEGGRPTTFFRQQADILLSDVFYDELNTSPLVQESDLAPCKPYTDVTFSAVARSPEAKCIESWPVHFTIKNRCAYGFHVFGERYWEAAGSEGARYWQLSKMKPMTELPLRYTYAYGGTIQTGENEFMDHAYNPVGCGMLSDYLLFKGDSVRVPQIGLLGEFADMQAGEPLTICGCGPLTKSWLPRLALAGTFDETWQKERHPLMPKDYDYAYWNAAPLPLQVAPYLRGDETIEIEGIRHKPGSYTFKLPSIALECRITRQGVMAQETLALNLDTLHCDVSHLEQEQHWMSLTWRLSVDNLRYIEQIELVAHPIQEIEQ